MYFCILMLWSYSSWNVPTNKAPFSFEFDNSTLATSIHIHHRPPFVCCAHKQVTQLEKFILKNQTLKAHEKKLQQQLQQKKEMGKAEYEVEHYLFTLYLNRLSVDHVVCQLDCYARERWM